MSLRLRIVLVMVLAAVVPVVVSGLLLGAESLAETRGEYARRLSASSASARHRVEDDRARERRAIERLCRDEILVDRLLLDLEAGRFGPMAQDDLSARLPGVMRSLGLDVLYLLDGRPGPRFGLVFAAGHFPGLAGATDGDLARAADGAGDRWFLRRLRIRSEGASVDVEARLGACPRREGTAQVFAVGGRIVDDAFVADLAAELPPVSLVLTGPDGTLPPGIAAGGGQDEVWTFTNLEGQPTRRLVAVVDDGPLRARERAFAQRLTLFAGLSAAGALLLGLLLAVGIARPLGELEAAADRVAEGDMSSTVPVRSGGEVGRVLTAFNRMTGELSRARDRLVRAERIAAWRDIARRIAHEIKNPLMPIQTSIETLRKVHQRGLPDFDEIFEESTVTILEEVDRMKRIVSEFSAFARMPRPRPEVFDLREVLEHVVGLHAATDVSVHLDAPEPLTVRADRGQLTQVFVNLVQNGSDAAASRHAGAGQVRIAAFATGGEVVVRVTDDGPGISPEEREKIFEPYYTTKSEGTGLGLAIVHRIVSDHGGRLDLGAGIDGGAAFEVVLDPQGPAVEADASFTH